MSDEMTPADVPAEASVVLAEELVARARAEGVELVGPGGLLTDLTKTVLETALEVEMDDHLGYPKHAVEGRDKGNSRNGTRPVRVVGRGLRSRGGSRTLRAASRVRLRDRAAARGVVRAPVARHRPKRTPLLDPTDMGEWRAALRRQARGLASHRVARRRGARRARWSTATPAIRSAVFPATEGGYVSLSNWRRRVWYPALERSGLERRPLYQMRHTFATLALAAGMPIDFVSRQSGHTDIRTTLRFYARYIPALEERHLAMLNDGWRTMTPISAEA